MKHLIETYPILSPYNKEVHDVFDKLLKATLKLLGTIERHELRCYLFRANSNMIGLSDHKVFELINPLLYLSLESHDEDTLTIHFGFEHFSGYNIYSPITARFVRLLYNFTAEANTAVNIEESINTDYVLHDCSALYETIEEKMRYHKLKVIPYKVASTKRNAAMALAS